MFATLLAGCGALEPASPALLERVQDEVEAPRYVRRRATVRLESSRLSGTFRAILIARRGVTPAARLQLFPAVGAKVLDLAIAPDTITGMLVGAPPFEHQRGDSAPRHLLAFLAASLLEELAPITAGRVRGARGDELHLAGVLEGTRVAVEFDAAGAVARRSYALRGVRWTESIDTSVGAASEREFRGRDFLWTLREVEESELADAPDAALFRLELAP
ncbi:MAG: hypothetical protein WD226_11800 [Planctomycetota bacterium]